MGWQDSARWNLQCLKEQPKLIDRYLSAYRDLVFMPDPSPVQCQALLWCIENIVPVNQFRRHNWVGVVFEHLVTHFHSEVERLYRELRLKRPILGYNWFPRASHTAQKAEGRTVDVLNKWRHQLSDREIEEIDSIVQGFALDFYDRGPYPSLEKLGRHIELPAYG